MAYDSLMVFTGNANPKLAADVVKRLNISLGRANVGRFSDGEVSGEILENVRGKDVFVLQSTCAPTNDNLMELMVMVDALKRSSAGRITAAIPYIGYARQDRRTALGARGDHGQGGGQHAADRRRAPRADGGPACRPDPGLLRHPGGQRLRRADPARRHLEAAHEDLLVVSPDVGGVVRARALAKRLESDLAIIDKRRPKANVSEVMNIIGEVDGRTCVIMDDMVDTAGTLCKAAQALKDHGAAKVLAYCTHPVLSGSAVERIGESVLDELVVTDTIPLARKRAPANASGRFRSPS
jgi:ribose-phosphate pyrophosphokinase